MKNKNLIILTESYPFSGGEQFLIREYFYVAKHFEKVYVFPAKVSTSLNPLLPENLIIIDDLSKEIVNSKLDYIRNFIPILSVLFIELKNKKRRNAFSKRFSYHLSEILLAIKSEKIFNKKLQQIGAEKNTTFHSAWMNKHALMLSIAKFKNHISEFTFRVHGYDIFLERRENNYMPFEVFIYKHAKHIILNSKYSFNYKKAQNIYSEKLRLNYFGIENNENSPFKDSEVFVLVSCSDIIPLKRVELIAEALSFVTYKLKWIHFGDGEKMKDITRLCATLPSNVEYELKGKTSNEEIMEFYRGNMINLFIHVSRTEGLGFALVEAQSFGIPILACAAGGVVDVVNEETGKLLPIQITSKELSEEILGFKESKLNEKEFRKTVKSFFNKTFSIEKTNSNFVKII